MSGPDRVGPGTWRHALLKSDLRHRVLLVAHTLATLMDREGETYAGLRPLANGSNQAINTVRKALAELIENGWLEERHIGHGREVYRYATVPGVSAQSDTPPSPEGVSARSDTPEAAEVYQNGSEGVSVSAEGVSARVIPNSINSNELQGDPSSSKNQCPPHDWNRLAPPRRCRNPQCRMADGGPDILDGVSSSMRVP